MSSVWQEDLHHWILCLSSFLEIPEGMVLPSLNLYDSECEAYGHDGERMGVHLLGESQQLLFPLSRWPARFRLRIWLISGLVDL